MPRVLGASAVALAAILVYARGLDAPFVFDDLSAITQNVSLRTLATALSPPPDTSLTGRPLVHASFAFGYALWGLDPGAHRALNLALHFVNALLLWRVLLALLRRPALPDWLRARAAPASAAIATLWTLHPLQSESVMYIVQRTELMAATCCLLTLHFAIRFFERAQRPHALCAALALAMGTGCKETIISAPALVLCIDLALYCPSLRRALTRHRVLYAGLFLALVPLAALQLAAPRGLTAGFGVGVSPLDYLALQGQAIVWYLRLAAWPDPLSVTYNWSLDGALGRYWPADAAMCALVVGTLYLTWRKRRAALPGWCFLILLAPSSSVVPILSEMVAERRMYLPLAAALSVPILLIVHAVSARPAYSLHRYATAACAALALAYTVRTSVRVNDYRSREALFMSALRAAPDNPQAMWGLATAYQAGGQPELALELFERMAAKRYPYVGPASFGTRGLIAKAELLEQQGQAEAAAATRRRALRHDPRSAVSRLQGAADLALAKDLQGAHAALTQLLDQPFLHDRIYVELGVVEARLGHEEAAREHFMRALSLTTDRERLETRIAEFAR